MNQRVERVQTTTKALAFTNGDSLTYDALLVATGGKPRQLDIPGADLQNILTLRSGSHCLQFYWHGGGIWAESARLTSNCCFARFCTF
ncbi:FAD-dependent oxidoreductase [Dendronalium sp. ChiSLP03b]|uniref:FAD-dependent oxidoreductase n=1 Tax=Dendronalium sp. ChiSLP03b TaxID=3075381 RepID=UPI00391B5848